MCRMIWSTAAHIAPAGLGLGPKLPCSCNITRLAALFLSVGENNAKYNKKVNVVLVAHHHCTEKDSNA